MGRLDGKVALVSGGARGQGLAAGRRLAAEGASVVLGDVLDGEGEAAAASLGSAGAFVHLDVASEGDWAGAVRAAEERFGRLDVLLNNAGILRFSPIEETALEDYLEVVRVNQVGVFLGMRAAIPAMRRAGGGVIVNVSSVEGLFGMAGLVAYAASKFAVRGMTKVAALELGADGIRVNSIHPGGIDTPMIRAQGLEGADLDRVFGGLPVPRAGRPEDVASLVAFLASDESSYITGAELVIDGGATASVSYTRGPRRRRE